MCESCDEERKRIAQIALQNPQPCLVCDETMVIAVGTWIPDAKHRLAAGATDTFHPIFGYWLCETHAEPTEENEKMIMQSVLRDVREGKGFDV